MSIDNVSGSGVASLTIGDSNINRFIPEPSNGLGDFFKGIVGGLGSAVTGAIEPALMGIDSQYLPFIEAQIHAQEQLQLVSMYSNIEKSKHESKMVAIRNVRVG